MPPRVLMGQDLCFRLLGFIWVTQMTHDFHGDWDTTVPCRQNPRNEVTCIILIIYERIFSNHKKMGSSGEPGFLGKSFLFGGQ